jgi:hypothetical protein
MSEAPRLRVWWLRLRLIVWWRWRRKVAGLRVPDRIEPDSRGPIQDQPDTGGGIYRAPFGSQFGDPSESHSSPHSEGSNCTMAAAGMALAHHTKGATNRRGGDLRHRQGDNDGGTDLYDAADAWASYGHSLSIRSGQGWGKVVAALEEGRGVILQGTGGIAGCGDYTGGHAIYVAPEKSGSKWLKGDPECGGYEWTEASKLEGFAERLSSGVYFAVTKAQTSSTPPPPTPVPCPPPPKVEPVGPEINRAYQQGREMALDAEVGSWLAWVSYRGRDSWGVAEWGCSHWSRAAGAIDPLTSARLARDTLPMWEAGGWRALTWG